MGYEYHIDSALVKPSSGFDPTLKVKTCFDLRMFDVTVANWVAHLNRENSPRGTPSHETLSVSQQGALEFFSYSNSNWTFIAPNLPIQEDSKAQQNQKSSKPNFSIQRQKRGRAPRRTPGDDPD